MTEQLTPVYPERFLRRACQNGALVSPSISPFRLSTADSQPFSSNSLSFTLLSKNAPANHLESHSCKNKGLKVLYHQHLQKRRGGTPTFDSQLPTVNYAPHRSCLSRVTSHKSQIPSPKSFNICTYVKTSS